MRNGSFPVSVNKFWTSAMRSKPLSNAPGEVDGGLERRLGPFDLVLLGIGASIGAGIFVVTGTVARDAGPVATFLQEDTRATLLMRCYITVHDDTEDSLEGLTDFFVTGVTISFVLAGASCVLNALCYAELASRFPAVVGGAYLYTYTAFNELTAFLVFTQMMLDYHIGAASIARSLASYVILIVLVVILVGAFEIDSSNWTPFAPNGYKSMLTGATVAFFAYVGFDAVANSAEESKRPQNNIPNWVGHGGKEIFGFISINLLAPVLLVLLTLILCRGVKESSLVNTIMTSTKVIYDHRLHFYHAAIRKIINLTIRNDNFVKTENYHYQQILIVLVVILVGAFEIDSSNWTPFAPNGYKSMLTGATVAFFAYVGFDAVANSAEESKRPQRDLPIGIIGSLLVCIALYIGVCLVITGMVPYKFLGEDAPLAEAFKSKGLKFVSILISVGAVAGLTTTLLVGLYVQSRLYLGLGRDGLLPAIFARVHPTRHTPIQSQIWVGFIACVLAGLLNVHLLSHVLSVGSLAGYSVVAACVITLRWKNNIGSQVSASLMSHRMEGMICITVIAACGFAAGILFRYVVSGLAYLFLIVPVTIAVLAASALRFRQVQMDPPGFSCPWVPIVPALCIFVNIFLFAQLHYEAWVRFIVLSIVAIGVYAFYGQHHAHPTGDREITYQKAPEDEAL
ncbi:amino acid/polyamine transporter I, Cationic amino acid transporter [Artemisia annua]|uniref:Amino acid/polyamine transporter I, Cationic amino acid transporter n=1 Tax=Artemisia annua TaxID=35608 RepID=A0A2U1P0N9_ARTAN|nr:amino acid/polyamine transporter I, Cationic amino acid transporter [Artemisia annua]